MVEQVKEFDGKSLRPNFEVVAQNKELVAKYWNLPKDTTECQKHYDELADKYDFILEDCCGYNDPYYVTEEVKKHIKPDQLICDFGCGTGILGRYLKKAGYEELYGCDGSDNMLKKNVELKLYKDVRKCLLTVDPFPEEWLNKFDCIVATGCFLTGHFPAATLEIMNKSLKIGGIAMFSMRDIYLEPDEEMQYKPMFDKLEKEGKIEIVEPFKYIKYEGIKAEEGFGKNFTETASRVFKFKRLA